MKKNITKKEKYRIIALRRKGDIQDSSGINLTRQTNIVAKKSQCQ